MEMIYIMDCFDDVEVEESHDGYFYKVSEVIKIIILGCLCGLKNVRQIHQWAVSDRVSEFLKEKFAIERVPCYYWMLCLLKIVKPESLSACFTRWVHTFLPEYPEEETEEKNQERNNLTVSFDGKTVRSTKKMKAYERPLHIVSAQLAELGLTFGQKAVEGKSNEIPAVRELLKELDVRGCVVVADALNCQEETAKEILKGGADYLLCVKGNQKNTRQPIAEYLHDESHKAEINTVTREEKNRGRQEKRTAYVTTNVAWFPGKKWPELACVGAIHREFEYRNKKTDEWHYYISSRKLTAEELLHRSRMEWSVESMHWILDVQFDEDNCRVEDDHVQRNLNILRKLAINLVKLFKEKERLKKPLSHIMFDSLLEPSNLLKVISGN